MADKNEVKYEGKHIVRIGFNALIFPDMPLLVSVEELVEFI